MQNLKAKAKTQGGFTLIEMLVVVAIIVILAAISIPVVNANLEKARDATDMANERAARTLALMYYEGLIDPNTTPIEGFDGGDAGGYLPGQGMQVKDDEFGNLEGVYYDAENGVLTCVFPRGKGYGQCTGHLADMKAKYNKGGATHVNSLILVEVDANGKFTPHWIADQKLT